MGWKKTACVGAPFKTTQSWAALFYFLLPWQFSNLWFFSVVRKNRHSFMNKLELVSLALSIRIICPKRDKKGKVLMKSWSSWSTCFMNYGKRHSTCLGVPLKIHPALPWLLFHSLIQQVSTEPYCTVQGTMSGLWATSLTFCPSTFLLGHAILITPAACYFPKIPTTLLLQLCLLFPLPRILFPQIRSWIPLLHFIQVSKRLAQVSLEK